MQIATENSSYASRVGKTKGFVHIKSVGQPNAPLSIYTVADNTLLKNAKMKAKIVLENLVRDGVHKG